MINYKLTAEAIKNSKYAIAFTGAGISLESGVPTFRGVDGVWEKHGISFAKIDFFESNPEESWKSLKAVFYDSLIDVSPNNAHKVLAKMETMGIIKSTITQNIDNLHQKAGSKNVYELHGTAGTTMCTKCKDIAEVTREVIDTVPHKCKKCDGVIKPNFTFFGEMLPKLALSKSIESSSMSDVCIIVGTTGIVMPAAQIPYIAKQNKAKIIEINPKSSNYTDDIVDIFIKERASIALTEIEKFL